MNFRSIGTDVKISRFARFYGNSKMSIGNNVRIDDFCLLSGSVTLKNNIHISAYCALYGGGRIIMHDNSGLSPRCTLLSATDDFSGNFLIGPHNDLENTNVLKAPIVLNKYCYQGLFLRKALQPEQ
jgi:galactoside O-acetyltransferase